MARPKSSRSAKKSASKNPEPARGNRSFLWPTVIVLLLILLAGWGVATRIRQGPATPIPRENFAFRLGVTADELKTTFPKLDLRPYNNDKDFRIANLVASDSLPGGMETIDLVYYKNRLFFMTQQWLKNDPTRNPEKIAYQYRRWLKPGGGTPQTLGKDTILREWFFQDGPTEMIIRELKYGNQYQFWQDLRDASDPEAKAAFAKYRIDQ